MENIPIEKGQYRRVHYVSALPLPKMNVRAGSERERLNNVQSAKPALTLLEL